MDSLRVSYNRMKDPSARDKYNPLHVNGIEIVRR